MSGQDDVGKWPSREEWAQMRRMLYEEQYPDISHVLSDYGSAGEIAVLKRALIARRRTYEAGTDRRDGVNRALLLIAENKLPVLLQDYLGADDIFAALHARYNAAREEAATSIDDAAWAKELEWRDEVEVYLGGMDAARTVSSAEPPGVN